MPENIWARYSPHKPYAGIVADQKGKVDARVSETLAGKTGILASDAIGWRGEQAAALEMRVIGDEAGPGPRPTWSVLQPRNNDEVLALEFVLLLLPVTRRRAMSSTRFLASEAHSAPAQLRPRRVIDDGALVEG